MRAARFVGQLVGGAAGVVHDRAPWLSERAYRMLTLPLLVADPAAAAQAVERRLDGVRAQIDAMATTGRVRPGDLRRIRRDLARAGEDVAQIAPRLSTVQARGLRLRLAAYDEVLGGLVDGSAIPEGLPRIWKVLVMAGSIAACVGILLHLTGPVAAVLLGLVAGVFTGVNLTEFRERRSGRVWIGALSGALTTADTTVAGPNRSRVAGLDRARHELITRSRGLLDERGRSALTAIDHHLDDLLVRLLEDDLGADGAHLVRSTVERYLPDTLEPFLAMGPGAGPVHGRSAVEEVADQLVTIESELAGLVRRPSRGSAQQRLFRQGEFLRSRFGERQAPTDET